MEVSEKMSFWFFVPGSSKNISQPMTFAELWQRTSGENELHYYWRSGQKALKSWNGAPWGLDYQQELRRLKLNAPPPVTLDFTADPDDVERGVSQPPHLTEDIFGVYEEVCYDVRRLSEAERNLWKLLRKYYDPTKLSKTKNTFYIFFFFFVCGSLVNA